ncbi:MAG: DUF2332 family protein, partial [Pseudomonadota bacterium]
QVSTDWQGDPPSLDRDIRVLSRSACDLNPIDLYDENQCLRLKAYTWPDQPDRLARLESAISLAQTQRVRVEEADAADWLAQILPHRPKSGVSVVFHSVFIHYLPSAAHAKIRSMIEAAGALATHTAPLAWLCMEPDSLFETDNPKLGVFRVRLQVWPSGETFDLAETDGHVTYLRVRS